MSDPLTPSESLPDSLSHLMSLIAHRRFISAHRMFYDWSVQTETKNGEWKRDISDDFIAGLTFAIQCVADAAHLDPASVEEDVIQYEAQQAEIQAEQRNEQALYGYGVVIE